MPLISWTTQSIRRIGLGLAVMHVGALFALYLVGDRIQGALLEPDSLTRLAPIDDLAWGVALTSACLTAVSWVVSAVRRTPRSFTFAVLWSIWFSVLVLAKLGAFASGAFIGETAPRVARLLSSFEANALPPSRGVAGAAQQAVEAVGRASG